MKMDRKFVVVGAMTLIAIVLYACTSETAQSTPTPTPVVEATSTLTPTPVPTLGMSRSYVQNAFEEAGFPEFYGFGEFAPDVVGTIFFPGTGTGIMVDIYGPASDIETVDMTFWLSGPIDQGLHDSAIALACELLMLTVVPEWDGGFAWLSTQVANFGGQDKDISISRHGKKVTAYYRTNGLVAVIIEGDQ